MTEAAKIEKVNVLDVQNQNEHKTFKRQLSAEVATTMATLTQQTAIECTDKEVQCAQDLIKKVRHESE